MTQKQRVTSWLQAVVDAKVPHYTLGIATSIAYHDQPNQRLIAKDLGVERITVARAVKQLKEAGLLEIEYLGKREYAYHLTFPENGEGDA
jgi:Mn-dependent DtxR family transcriptional regulator